MLTLLKFSRPAGAWITLGLATLIIFLFFHRNILEANRVSFAAGGDGLKSTFGSLYHIQYDSSYWMFEGMNYPYGESVFYTGNQTFLTNGIKLLKNRGLDLSGHTLGLLNLWMLFSFALCALLLYLVMAELGLPPWYAVAGSIVITFLSPQWYRMSGHYNLAYAWVIPLALYLMIRFYRKPGYLVSVLFGLFVLVISFKHAYFLAMVALPWTVFWLFLLMCSKSLYGKTAFLVPHLLIQMLIPVLIFGLFAASHDPAADRTAYPWGFFANTTRWVSVFLPLMKPYGRWIIVGPVKTLGYVGIVSTLVFLVSAGLLILRWIRRGAREAFTVTDKFILNVLFLGGILCLIMALGYPFTWRPSILNYAGPFRQFRAIGRFVIPFFYIMNIYTIYVLWHWYTSLGKRWFGDFVMIALVLAGFEGYITVRDLPASYYNKFETLNDRENTIPDDSWVNRHDWKEYQSILPMPYYHIGSENYWIGDGSPVIEESYIASLKTGLPLSSVMLSRTSISQTLANLDLFWEPGRSYPVLERMDPVKPVLVVRHRKGILNENESRIIGKSVAIDSNRSMLFYRLYPDSLERILQEHAEWMARKAALRRQDTSDHWYYFESYDSLENGEFSGEIKYYTEFAGCILPDSGRFVASFWYEGAGRDLWPRTNLFVSLFDSSMTSYYYPQLDFFRETIMREGDRALVSVSFEVRHPGDVLKLHYINHILTGGRMRIDRVLVRRESDDVVLEDSGGLLLNTRPVVSPSIP
jgi:hypothetical protein